jgi:hypothetical protein
MLCKTFLSLVYRLVAIRVSFKYLEKLYKIQNDKYDTVSRGGLRVIRKWTHAIIYPNSFQKMRGFYAAQVLSKSASYAIGYFHYDAGQKLKLRIVNFFFIITVFLNMKSNLVLVQLLKTIFYWQTIGLIQVMQGLKAKGSFSKSGRQIRRYSQIFKQPSYSYFAIQALTDFYDLREASEAYQNCCQKTRNNNVAQTRRYSMPFV